MRARLAALQGQEICSGLPPYRVSYRSDWYILESQFIKSKKRARLHATTAEKIQFVSINGFLELPPDKKEFDYNFSLWTEDDEEINFFDAQPGAVLKPDFLCYAERNDDLQKDETTLVVTQSQNSAFWLNSKLRGVYLFDGGESVAEHRGNYRIQSVAWQERARIGRVTVAAGYRAHAQKLEYSSETCKWVEVGDEEPYLIDEILYNLIAASRKNDHLNIIEKAQ